MKSSGRTRRRLKRFIVSATTLIAICGYAEAQSPASNKIYSRKNAFRIPFQIPNQNEQKLLEEVQLYVSRDGTSWKKYTSASPTLPKEKQSFVFRANEDGEYRFSVRTMDRRGKLNPEDDSKLAVGLHVVVDTVSPGIKLQSLPVTGGKVAIGWEIQDKNLNLDTLKLEYRTANSDNWIPLTGISKKFVGEHSWIPETTGEVTVRCQVEDFAKNLAIEGIELNSNSFANSDPRLPDLPGTTPSFDPITEANPAASQNLQGSNPPPPLEFGDSRLDNDALSDDPPLRFGTDAVPSGTSPSTPNSFPSDDEIINGFQLNTGAPTLDGGSTRQPSATVPSFGGSSNSRPDLTSLGGGTSARNTTAPEKSLPKFDLDPNSSLASNQGYPPDRMIVSDNELTLDYELQDVGASGVSQVEVYATPDRGRTWNLVGVQKEPNPRSSVYKLNMKLAGEGLYGLAIVAKNGLGFGDQPPRSGQEPQIWVEIDQVAPVVQVNPPQVKGRQVLITWNAQDTNLDERPVTLVYDDGTGLRQIAVDLPNNGSYVWNVTGNVPAKFRVGIQVLDRAGNKGTEWSEEVVADNSRPRARVIGIKPTGRTVR